AGGFRTVPSWGMAKAPPEAPATYFRLSDETWAIIIEEYANGTTASAIASACIAATCPERPTLSFPDGEIRHPRSGPLLASASRSRLSSGADLRRLASSPIAP
ncbi:MAG: hypothetical protein ACK5R8_02400, partial [Brevundimonas sp.]